MDLLYLFLLAMGLGFLAASLSAGEAPDQALHSDENLRESVFLAGDRPILGIVLLCG
jgi:hypothetical protein